MIESIAIYTSPVWSEIALDRRKTRKTLLCRQKSTYHSSSVSCRITLVRWNPGTCPPIRWQLKAHDCLDCRALGMVESMGTKETRAAESWSCSLIPDPTIPRDASSMYWLIERNCKYTCSRSAEHTCACAQFSKKETDEIELHFHMLCLVRYATDIGTKKGTVNLKVMPKIVPNVYRGL